MVIIGEPFLKVDCKNIHNVIANALAEAQRDDNRQAYALLTDVAKKFEGFEKELRDILSAYEPYVMNPSIKVNEVLGE